MSGAAFAQATLELKDSNSNGSSIGQQSSGATGNGDWVSGNGTTATVEGGVRNQTTYPGSRADLVHESNTQSHAGGNGKDKGSGND